MLPEVKGEALKRLNYIEGHLLGIKRMVEGDKYCVDVLKQTFAVRRAIEKVETILLGGTLRLALQKEFVTEETRRFWENWWNYISCPKDNL